MKRLILITSSKGGSGKSTLTWLCAQKYPDAVYLDMDDGTTTTMKQLRYLNPHLVSFLNSTNTIDRGRFNDFLEYIGGHEKNMFICDLGASLSEQLPYYLKDHGADVIRAGLDALNVEMNIICIVGGQNIFAACMSYLDELFAASLAKINIRVAINDHYPLSDLQQEEFTSYCKSIKLKDPFHFNLSKDKNLTVQEKVNNILKDGNGLQNASVFSKILFANSINNLTI
jgi:hypothetical protein